ncbi:MAG: Unknown protein [uncultured Sulfurovum sp.]|uniref:Uncharacterized protein n=1 Tax=uncultured Sulfurovum sp. TaxID=269237 RepID=A0A6S6SSS7_9BACT|nr:MAG: Unknown protein [uncultured Sulfurovum sp.]
MQEDNRRLIDEALNFEPVKNTFRLAWEFIILNKKFTSIAIGIFILLNLFAAVPLLSLVFVVLAAVFGVVIQMHVGRTFYATEDIESYVQEIQSSRIEEILSKHVSSAFGVYLGWLLLVFLILILIGFMGAITGLFHEKMTEADVLASLASIGLPLILIAFAFSYVQPLVQSNIVLAKDLKEGFKAVFTLFSKDVWSSAMKKGYFAYVVKVGLVLMAVLFSAGLTATFLTMVPVLGFIASIVLLVFMYVFMIFMSIMSMMARRMVEE